MINQKLWLILGGSGQIGTSLQESLLKANIKFMAPSSKQLNIKDFKKIQETIYNIRPHVVINCAGWTNVEQAEIHAEQANILNGYAVENLIHACKKVSSTLAHISTDYVFSGNKGKEYYINDSPDPINVYGKSKLFGEEAIKTSNASKYYIFRTAWVYSQFGNNFVKSIIKKYKIGNTSIKVVNDQFGNPTLATDFSVQIIESIRMNVPFGTYHVVNSGVASWYDLALETFAQLNFNTRVLEAIDTESYTSLVHRPRYTSIDSFDWNTIRISPMRSWQSALKFSIRKIAKTIV